MDTTTVNYALSKLAEGYSKIAPTVVDVSEKYVRYIVMQEVVGFLISVAVTLMAAPIIALGIFLIRNSERSDDGYEISAMMLFGIGAMIFVFGTVFCCTEGYEAFIAYTNPEMYSIQQLIKSVK